MQKQNDQLRDFTLLPVPTVLLDELDIDAFSTIQFRLSRGGLFHPEICQAGADLPEGGAGGHGVYLYFVLERRDCD